MDRAARPIIMIALRHDATASGERDQPAFEGARGAVALDLATGLYRLGHAVEFWTRQLGDPLEVEVIAGTGVRLRGFRCGERGSVRELTPCEYITEWVGEASEYLARCPATGAVLVSHYWDAGIAGKLLSNRFGLAHVNLPHRLGVAEGDAATSCGAEARDVARRIHEEREVYRAASRVIATSPAQRDLLVGSRYRVSSGKVGVVRGADAARQLSEILSLPDPDLATAAETRAGNTRGGGFSDTDAPFASDGLLVTCQP